MQVELIWTDVTAKMGEASKPELYARAEASLGDSPVLSVRSMVGKLHDANGFGIGTLRLVLTEGERNRLYTAIGDWLKSEYIVRDDHARSFLGVHEILVRMA